MRAFLTGLFLGLLVLCAAPEAHANCTAPCTKAQITTDINANWPDNTVGAITPALLRSTVSDLLNSYLDVNGSSTFTCSTHQFLVSIATLSSYACAQPAAGDISGAAALTGVNDTNVTVTLGGTPASALLAATSITLGWTGTLAVARGGTGDSGTAWSSWTPSPACGTGTFTTTTAHFKQVGKTVWAEMNLTVTSATGCSNSFTFTGPVTTASAGALTGREVAINAKGVSCTFNGATSTGVCTKADASAILVNEQYVVSGVLESQ